jgi:hypothetical protein
MKCSYYFLFFLLGCTSVIYSQTNTHVLLLKKNNRTFQKFFPEQFIFFQSGSGLVLGKIQSINPQSLTIQIVTIQEKKSDYGTNVRDTLLKPANPFSINAITGVYIPKGQKSDGIYFTETFLNKTSLKGITAPEGEAFYDTYWNTGEAGYLATAAFNTMLDKIGKKKIKDMRKIGKKYSLAVI